MKQIFRLCLVAIACLMVLHANAQEKATTFSMAVGLNLSTYGGDVSSAFEYKPGVSIGFDVNHQLANSLYLKTGIGVTMIGGKIKDNLVGGVDLGEMEDASDISINPVYLHIPLHLAFKAKASETAQIVLHAGPYIACGVGGNVSAKVDGQKVTASGLYVDGGFKRFDAGFGLGVGLELDKLIFDLGFDAGLTNCADTDVSFKNRNIFLKVGYKF